MPPAAINFVVPGDINTLTGGYGYDRRIMEELRKRSVEVGLVTLHGDFPFPATADLRRADGQLARLPEQSVTVIDGLAFSVMPEILAVHGKRLQVVALIHHPLALETGISDAQAIRLRQSEQQALQHARRVITTSHVTATSLRDYRVPEHRVTAVLPGTDPRPLSTGSTDGTFNLLCVATLTQRKGHSILLDALAGLQDLPWQLSCVGSTERDASIFHALQEQRATLGLSDRVRFVGEVDEAELQSAYKRADLFVLASYHEGYGMVLGEAIACGLPIIATDAGAIPQTIPSGAGLLVPPGDSVSLANSLRLFMEDSITRESLKTESRRARATLPGWAQAARDFHAALPV